MCVCRAASFRTTDSSAAQRWRTIHSRRHIPPSRDASSRLLVVVVVVVLGKAARLPPGPRRRESHTRDHRLWMCSTPALRPNIQSSNPSVPVHPLQTSTADWSLRAPHYLLRGDISLLSKACSGQHDSSFPLKQTGRAHSNDTCITKKACYCIFSPSTSLFLALFDSCGSVAVRRLPVFGQKFTCWTRLAHGCSQSDSDAPSALCIEREQANRCL